MTFIPLPIRRIAVLLCLHVALCSHAIANVLQDTLAVIRRDSVKQEPQDTLRYRTIPGLGSIHQRIDSTSILHSSQVVWTDSKYLGDLLWKIPGFYLRDLGEAGKLNQFTAFGLDWRGIPILLDGRPLNDPLTGAVNLYDIPIESIEQIEVLDGADALMLGSQSAGINLVTSQYNNTRPITKLRYMQGPFNYGLTDALFAQNVARGTNLMLGVQRHVSDGRFTNSVYDSWHVRSRLRYNYSDRFNIALSHFYGTATNGQNDGIDTTSPSSFDEVNALVRNDVATDDVSRHDVTLNGIARLSSDSTSTTQFSLFYTEIDRIYNHPDSIIRRATSSLMGARILQNIAIGNLATTVGADIQRERLPGSLSGNSYSPYHAGLFGKAKFDLLDFLKPSASFRLDQQGARSAFSYGLGMTVSGTNWVTIGGNYSVSRRFPSSYEPRPSLLNPSLSDVGEYETIDVKLEFFLGNSANISLRGYHQSVSNIIWYERIITNPPYVFVVSFPTIKNDAVTGSFSFRWWKLESVWTGIFTKTQHDGTVKNFFPQWTTTGELAYRDIVLKDVMELRTGVRFRYASRHQGTQFYPQQWLYTENAGEAIEHSSRLDLFAVAHLGDAYLTLSWENLLNENYTTVSRYPMPNRTFRLGVNWTFFD